jgi:hypothetical protein
MIKRLIQVHTECDKNLKSVEIIFAFLLSSISKKHTKFDRNNVQNVIGTYRRFAEFKENIFIRIGTLF